VTILLGVDLHASGKNAAAALIAGIIKGLPDQIETRDVFAGFAALTRWRS